MQATSNLKLPLYQSADKADLIAGYNKAATALDSLIGQAVLTYVLASGTAALPSGARTPCLIVTAAGELWFEDGKAASDEPGAEGPGPMDEPQVEEPGADGSVNPGDAGGTQTGDGE